jgi:hypothetical protein
LAVASGRRILERSKFSISPIIMLKSGGRAVFRRVFQPSRIVNIQGSPSLPKVAGTASIKLDLDGGKDYW